MAPLRAALDALRARLDAGDASPGSAEAALALAARAIEAVETSPAEQDTELGRLRRAVRQTNEALELKLEELSLLRQITDATSRAVHAPDPFRLLLERTVTLLKADNGSIMLVDRTAHQLVVRSASGTKDDLPHMPRFSLGEGVAGEVARTGKPLLIPDIAANSTFVQLPGHRVQRGALLCFPLVVQGQTIGVINLSADRPHTFTEETARVAHILAAQMAVAIENSRLYDELKETKDYLENLVERAGASIFTLDRQGLIGSWNAGAREMYRLPAREVLGRGPEVFLPAPELEAVGNAINTVLHDGGVISLCATGLRGDGTTLTTDLTLSPIRDSRGQIVGVSGIGKDISEQKGIEEELRSLNEAKSNFVSMVSHELRTPLTSVKSFVEIMIDESAPTPPDKQRRYLHIINEECDRLDHLISDLLDLQKAEAGAVELRRDHVVVAEVVHQALQLYAPVAERQHITLDGELHDSTPPGTVCGDRDKLYQVLGNLLNNALKFTPRGGCVTVRQDTLDGEIRLTVTDTGPGLKPAELERVFDKFYQVDNTIARHVEGTGLGLAICREIVQAHEGKIWADSEPGHGATFGMRLPRSKA